MRKLESVSGWGKWLNQLAFQVVSGDTVEEILELVYRDLSVLLPFSRIGYAEIDTELGCARARWAKSDGQLLLKQGYVGKLAGSSLGVILEHQKPRILNDLVAYLEKRPNSHATRLMVYEGFLASLTVPVTLGGRPIAFLFFSSRQKDVFVPDQIPIAQDVALMLGMAHSLTTAKQPNASVDHRAESSLETNGSAGGGLLDSRADKSGMGLAGSPPKSEVFRGRRKLSLAQLRPGMVLMESAVLLDGVLLVAENTVLTNDIIQKLTELRQKGLLAHAEYEVSTGESAGC